MERVKDNYKYKLEGIGQGNKKKAFQKKPIALMNCTHDNFKDEKYIKTTMRTFHSFCPDCQRWIQNVK